MAILSDDQRDALVMLATHNALLPDEWIPLRRVKVQLDCRALARLGFAEVREEGGFAARVTRSGRSLAAGIAANNAAAKGGA